MAVVARWNGTEIARSSNTVVVEGNHYFPRSDVRADLLLPSDTTTVCAWKGLASYHSIAVGDAINRDAAWYYSAPKPAASEIAGRIAFWKGVEVSAE